MSFESSLSRAEVAFAILIENLFRLFGVHCLQTKLPDHIAFTEVTPAKHGIVRAIMNLNLQMLNLTFQMSSLTLHVATLKVDTDRKKKCVILLL